MDVKDQATQNSVSQFNQIKQKITPEQQKFEIKNWANLPRVEFGGAFNPINWIIQAGEDILNVPTNVAGGVVDIFQGRPLQGVGRIGQAGFDVATTVLAPAKGLSVAGKGASQVFKAGAKEGIKLGALSGVFQGLQQAEGKRPEEIIPTIAGQTGIGAVTGGLIGGGLSVAGRKIGEIAGQRIAQIQPSNLTEGQKYVRELVKKQTEAREAGASGIFQRIKNITNEVDVKLQDFTTPINQAVNKAIKEGKKIEPLQNPIFQIDRVLRANSIASQFLKDNGLTTIIKNVDNIDEFNQYLIAKSTQ